MTSPNGLGALLQNLQKQFPATTGLAKSVGSMAGGMAKNVYQVSTPGILTSLLQKMAPGAAQQLPKAMQKNAAPLGQVPGQAAMTLGGMAAGGPVPEESTMSFGDWSKSVANTTGGDAVDTWMSKQGWDKPDTSGEYIRTPQQRQMDPAVQPTINKPADWKKVQADAGVKPTPEWPAAYQNSPQTLSNQGGGGANYTADDLAALKKRYGIQ